MKLILSLLLLSGASYANAVTTTTTAASTNTTTVATNATAPMTDAQIAAVVKTANDGEIDEGKHAKSHAKNAKVKKYASEMVMHHTQANKDAKKLLSKIDVKPEDNQTSQDLEKTVKSDMNTLMGLKGSEYDMAYIHSQVTTHEAVLKSLDDSLIPNAKNADLKAMLEKTRATVAKHLDEAKSIEASL